MCTCVLETSPSAPAFFTPEKASGASRRTDAHGGSFAAAALSCYCCLAVARPQDRCGRVLPLPQARRPVKLVKNRSPSAALVFAMAVLTDDRHLGCNGG